jgi:hypothetical protein
MKKYAAAALLLSMTPAFAGAAALQETATAGTTTHTKRLVLHETAFNGLSRHDFAGTDKARSRSTGKVVGFDTFTGHVYPHERIVFQAAFAFKGGLILVRVHVDGGQPRPRFEGRVTGGTGVFHGVTGTVSGRDAGHGKTFFNIRYML